MCINPNCLVVIDSQVVRLIRGLQGQWNQSGHSVILNSNLQALKLLRCSIPLPSKHSLIAILCFIEDIMIQNELNVVLDRLIERTCLRINSGVHHEVAGVNHC